MTVRVETSSFEAFSRAAQISGTVVDQKRFHIREYGLRHNSNARGKVADHQSPMAHNFISMNVKDELQRQLGKELRNHHDATRAAEGVYALCMDANFEPREALAALQELGGIPDFQDAARAIMRLFTENENLEMLTRERLLARRQPPRASVLEMARLGEIEGLRRVSGRDLQHALRAAKPNEAQHLITAWNQLSNFEQTRV